MSRTILAGLAGVAVGFAVGYVVVKQACKDRIVGGARDAVKAAGGGSTIQDLVGGFLAEQLADE